jgi:hypothetical protein
MGAGSMEVVRWQDLPWKYARPQRLADGRSAAYNFQTLDSRPDRLVLHGRYDPGVVIRTHTHLGDEVMHVIEGELIVGDVHIVAPATILFPGGTSNGPYIGGPGGATTLEVFIGGSEVIATDDDEWYKVLAERGSELLPDPTGGVNPPE